MNENRLEGVRQTLEKELQRLDAEATRLKAELAAAEADRRPIAAALSALGKKRPPKPAKPAPKKEQVLSIAVDLLEANGPLPAADLEGLIKDRLTDTGTSHSGFGLRLAEALKDDRLVVADGEVALASVDASG